MNVLSKVYWGEVFNPAMILKTSLQTIIGSVLVGSFFMVFSDYIFQPPNMNGRWELTLKPKTANGRMNQCVNITYTVLFMQKGVDLVAGGEKIRDTKSTADTCDTEDIPYREIPPGKGKKIKIVGFIQNNYFTNDDMTLSYNEGKPGNLRFTMGELALDGSTEFKGTYHSSISRAEGDLYLKKIH